MYINHIKWAQLLHRKEKKNNPTSLLVFKICNYGKGQEFEEIL